MSVPGPSALTLPLPLTTLLKVELPERLNARTPLSVTALVPLIEPVEPPAPICRVPPLIVVPPV